MFVPGELLGTTLEMLAATARPTVYDKTDDWWKERTVGEDLL
jgi:hypothetical protein